MRSRNYTTATTASKPAGTERVKKGTPVSVARSKGHAFMSRNPTYAFCSTGGWSRVSGATIQPIAATSKIAPLIANAHSKDSR